MQNEEIIEQLKLALAELEVLCRRCKISGLVREVQAKVGNEIIANSQYCVKVLNYSNLRLELDKDYERGCLVLDYENGRLLLTNTSSIKFTEDNIGYATYVNVKVFTDYELLDDHVIDIVMFAISSNKLSLIQVLRDRCKEEILNYLAETKLKTVLNEIGISL